VIRVLVITHADKAFNPSQYGYEFARHLNDLVDLTIVEWERMTAPSAQAAADVANIDLEDVDVVLMWVRFRHRVDGPAFSWDHFRGQRVWMEHDAWLNFLPYSAFYGKFPPVFRRDKFDLMISTGRRTRDGLRAAGVDAEWMPKGFSSTAFRDLGSTNREGACTFGTAWPSRRSMMHRVRRRGIDLVDVSGPFDTLNVRLNRYASSVVCNMPGRPPIGKPGRAIARIWPEFVRTEPAIEPMIKTFEVAGSGCALVVDEIQELASLGFVNGETCLTYRTFDEAARLLRRPQPELLAIGRAGAALARSHHTWRNRAELLVDILSNR
jgi:hypothetical protein